MNASQSRETGTVKWFSREKGWGFVRRGNGDEIFVHHSDIIGDGHVSLEDDEEVEFAVEEMEKGPRAREVRRLADGRLPDDRPVAGDIRRDAPGAPVESTSAPVSASAATETPRAPADAPADHVGDMLRRRLADRFPGLFDR